MKTQAFIASKQWPALSGSNDSAPVLTELFESDTQDHNFKSAQDIDFIPVSNTHQLLMLGDDLGVFLYAKQKREEFHNGQIEESQYIKESMDELAGRDKFKTALKARHANVCNVGESIYEGIRSHLLESEEPDLGYIYEELEGSTNPTRQRLKFFLPDYAEIIAAAWKQGEEDRKAQLAHHRQKQDAA